MRHSGFILLLAAAALFAGCAKDNGLKGTQKGEPVIFTATIAGTKTALSVEGTVGKVVWEDNDEITINGVAYVATPDSENPAMATFAPKGAEEAEPVGGKYYAVYSCEFDAEAEEGVLPAAQTYNANSLAGVAPMYAESSTTDLAFANICSLLEINLKGEAEVENISVSSSNLPMSGAFFVSEGYAIVYEEGIAGVTLDCGGAKLSADGIKFYIAVPAGVYKDLKIKAVDTDGKSWSITAPNEADINVNKIFPLTFTPVFAEDILLNGEFTVNANGGKVQFARGNLACSEGKYSFELSQTGVGTLFSSSEAQSIDPSSFCGQPVRMLSAAEWSYLLVHTDRVKLYSVDSCNGVILIPNGVDVTTDMPWSTLEANGAVFIPAAGYAYGTSAVCGLNEGGSYWTADSNSLDFDACQIYTDVTVPEAIRQSVRYVVDVK